MKKLFLFLLIFGSLVFIFCANDFVAIAINQLIVKLFVENSKSFECICDGKDSEKMMNRILRASPISYASHGLQLDSTEVTKINRSTFLFFKTFDSYKESFSKILLEGSGWSTKDRHILVYIENFQAKDKDTLKMMFDFEKEKFKPVKDSVRFNLELFLRRTQDGLELFTFELFKQPQCREWTVTELNIFSLTDWKWRGEKFFIEKFLNFNGCDLSIFGRSHDPLEKTLNTKSAVITYQMDFAIKLMVELQSGLNYSIKIIDPEQEDTIADVSLAVLPMRVVLGNDQTSHPLYPLVSTETFFYVTLTELYTPFEKLFLPFQEDVWLCLILTFAIAVVVIFVLRFVPKKIQRFVIGSRVKTPMMNLA